MRKSARLLEQDLGISAREMNALLRQYGYLEGVPGNYPAHGQGQAVRDAGAPPPGHRRLRPVQP
ncbi:hypothetical protein [Streptomyces clavuligerus]|uniref:hypothetical protein n=1 Tax=Streptomyces clavuligerus TaxID=1901 RepID=UPI0018D1E0F8|nr:hypothetical protein [Streptomyces clavuligerus]